MVNFKLNLNYYESIVLSLFIQLFICFMNINMRKVNAATQQKNAHINIGSFEFFNYNLVVTGLPIFFLLLYSTVPFIPRTKQINEANI